MTIHIWQSRKTGLFNSMSSKDSKKTFYSKKKLDATKSSKLFTLQSGLHYISAENLTDNYIEHWPTNTQITPKKTAERKMKLTLKNTIIILFHCVMWQRKVLENYISVTWPQTCIFCASRSFKNYVDIIWFFWTY